MSFLDRISCNYYSHISIGDQKCVLEEKAMWNFNINISLFCLKFENLNSGIIGTTFTLLNIIF